MNLVEMVECEVILRETVLKIRCVDADAPDDRVLRTRIEKIAKRMQKTAAEVAEIIYTEIIRTGKTATEIIRETEENLIYE